MDVLIGAASAQASASGPASASASTSYSALFVLMVTIVGFVFPMVFIYPPVAPQPSDLLSETHTRLGEGDEDRQEKGRKEKDQKDSKARLAAILIRPFCWCAGIAVARCRVHPTGLAGDGLFVFAQLRSPFPETAGETVSPATSVSSVSSVSSVTSVASPASPAWSLITPAQFPRLAQLQVELWRPDVAKAKKAQERMRADYRAERAPTMGQTFALVRFPWDGVAAADASGSAAVARLWARFLAKLARGWRAEPEKEVVVPVIEAATQETKTKPEAYAVETVRFDHGPVRARDLTAELPRELQLFLGVSNRLGLFQLAEDGNRGIELVDGSRTADGQPALASLTVTGVSVDETTNTVVFQAETAETAEDTRFRVSRVAGSTVLTPVTAQQPEQQETVLEVGMAVRVE